MSLNNDSPNSINTSPSMAAMLEKMRARHRSLISAANRRAQRCARDLAEPRHRSFSRSRSPQRHSPLPGRLKMLDQRSRSPSTHRLNLSSSSLDLSPSRKRNLSFASQGSNSSPSLLRKSSIGMFRPLSPIGGHVSPAVAGSVKSFDSRRSSLSKHASPLLKSMSKSKSRTEFLAKIAQDKLNLSGTSENDSILSNSPSRRSVNSLRDLSLISSTNVAAAASPRAQIKHVSPALSHKQSQMNSISPLRPETLMFSKQGTEGPPCKLALKKCSDVSKSASKKHRAKARVSQGFFKSAVGPKNDERRFLRSRDGQRRPAADIERSPHVKSTESPSSRDLWPAFTPDSLRRKIRRAGAVSNRLVSPCGRNKGGFPRFFALPEDVHYHILHFVQSQDLLSFACCSTSLKHRSREVLRSTFLEWFDIYPERVSVKKIFWAVHRIHHMTKRRAVELLHFSSARNYPKFVAWFLDSYLAKVVPPKAKSGQAPSSSSSSTSSSSSRVQQSPSTNASRVSDASAASSSRATSSSSASQAPGAAQGSTAGGATTTNSTSSSLVNATSGSESMTALHYAAGNNSISCLELLLATKAIDINRVAKSNHSGGHSSGYCGRTASHFAADQCHAEALSMIVDHPSWNPDVRDGGGRTVLFCVASMGMNDLVGKLIEKKVDTTVTDRSGKTPLYAAAESGFADVCHTLLEETSVDVLQSATTGKSPLYAASENGHHERSEAADVLLSHGADIRQETFREKIPLYAAAEQGHAKVVKVLLKYTKQADLFKLNRYGTTPMFIASKQANKAVKNLFLKFCLKKSQQKAERRADRQREKNLKRHRSAPPGRRRGCAGGPKATPADVSKSSKDSANDSKEASESKSPVSESTESAEKPKGGGTVGNGNEPQHKKGRPKSRKQSGRAVSRGRPQTRGGSPHVKFSPNRRRPWPDSSTDDADSSSCSNASTSRSQRSELDEFDREVELIHARARTKGLRIVTPRYLEDLTEFTQQSTKQRVRRSRASVAAMRSESQAANDDNGDASGGPCSRARVQLSDQKASRQTPYRPTGAPRAAAAAAARRFSATTTAAPSAQRVVKASGQRSAVGSRKSEERPTSTSIRDPPKKAESFTIPADNVGKSDEPPSAFGGSDGYSALSNSSVDASKNSSPEANVSIDDGTAPSAFGCPTEESDGAPVAVDDRAVPSAFGDRTVQESIQGSPVSTGDEAVPSAFGDPSEDPAHSATRDEAGQGAPASDGTVPSAFTVAHEAAARSDDGTCDADESACDVSVPSAFEVAHVGTEQIEARGTDESPCRDSLPSAFGSPLDGTTHSDTTARDIDEQSALRTSVNRDDSTFNHEGTNPSVNYPSGITSARTLTRESLGTLSLKALRLEPLSHIVHGSGDLPSSLDCGSAFGHRRALTERKAPESDSTEKEDSAHNARPLSLRTSSRLLRRLARPLPPLSQRTKLAAILAPILPGIPSKLHSHSHSLELGPLSMNLDSSLSSRPLTSPHSLPARISPLSTAATSNPDLQRSTAAPFTADQQRSTFRNSRASTAESDHSLPKQTTDRSGIGRASKSGKLEDSPKLLKRLSSSSKLLIAKVPPKAPKETNVMEIYPTPKRNKANNCRLDSSAAQPSPSNRISPHGPLHSPRSNKASSSVDQVKSSKSRRDPADSTQRIRAPQRNPSRGSSKYGQRAVPRLRTAGTSATKTSAQSSPRRKETKGAQQQQQRKTRRRSSHKTKGDSERSASGSPDSEAILSPKSSSSSTSSRTASQRENDFLRRQSQFAEKVKTNRERREQTAFEEATMSKTKKKKRTSRRSTKGAGGRRSSLSKSKSQRRLDKIRSIYDSPLPRRRKPVTNNSGALPLPPPLVPMVYEDEVEFVGRHSMVPSPSRMSPSSMVSPSLMALPSSTVPPSSMVGDAQKVFDVDDMPSAESEADRSLLHASYGHHENREGRVNSTSLRGDDAGAARQLDSYCQSSKRSDPAMHSPDGSLDYGSSMSRWPSKARAKSLYSAHPLDEGANIDPFVDLMRSQHSSGLSFAESRPQSRFCDDERSRTASTRTSKRMRREHLDRTRRVYSQNVRGSRERDRERKRSGSRSSAFSKLMGDSAAGTEGAFSSLMGESTFGTGGECGSVSSQAADDDMSSVRSVGRLKPLLAARRRIGFLSYSQTRKLMRDHQKYRPPPKSTHASLLPDLMSRGAGSRPISRTSSRASTSYGVHAAASRHDRRAPHMSESDLSADFDFLRVASVTPMTAACHSPAQLRAHSGRHTSTPQPNPRDRERGDAGEETVTLGSGRYSPLSASLTGTPHRDRPRSSMQ